jgi:S-adenosylmethionine synthetase
MRIRVRLDGEIESMDLYLSINRPMGTEAAADKNPVSHVGKICNVLAHRIAKRYMKVAKE